MKQTPRAAGFSLIELLAVLLTVAVLAAIALPAIGKARQTSGVEESLANLVTLGVAHVLYAADWNGRQVTWAVDDLGVYGSVENYCAVHGGCEYYDDPSCHPPVLVGWGCNDDGDCRLYAFRPCLRPQHDWVVEPIGFPGCGNAGIEGAGHFRYPTAKAFHDYVNGRWYDPTFYAPNDSVPYTLAATLFDEPWDYSPVANPPYLSSYSFSAAAMFDPDVMRSNAAGGWQCAWDLDYGFRSPGLFQAQYPDLKTQMIEHHWVQGPPAECNPNPPPDLGSYEGCTPYYFNHGIDSTPVTLFYDGHVRLLPNTEVFAADQQILKQTGGVDGLWHRRTPFGVDGYYISYGYDGAPLSHHILTTDGILGRDTLGGMPPMPVDGPRQWAPQKPRPFRSTGLANHQLNITLTTEGNVP